MSFYHLTDEHGDPVGSNLYYCDRCGVVIYEPYPLRYDPELTGYGQTDKLDAHDLKEHNGGE